MTLVSRRWRATAVVVVVAGMVVTVAVEAVAAGAEVSGLLSKLPMHTSCLEC